MCDNTTKTLLVAGAGALVSLIETWLGYSECPSNSIVEAAMTALCGCRKEIKPPFPIPPPALDDVQVKSVCVLPLSYRQSCMPCCL